MVWGKWKWLGFLFALFEQLGFGRQYGSVKHCGKSTTNTLHIDPLTTGIIIASIAGLVIIGGVKRISTFASTLVPIRPLYNPALTIVIMNLNKVPEAFG